MERLANLNSKLTASTKKQYLYTTEQGCLTPEQRDFYEENGFIVIKNFLDDTDIQKWKNRFLDYCDKKIPP